MPFIYNTNITINHYDGLYFITKGSRIVGNNIINVAKKLGICDWRFNYMLISNRFKASLNEKKKKYLYLKKKIKQVKNSESSNDVIGSLQWLFFEFKDFVVNQIDVCLIN